MTEFSGGGEHRAKKSLGQNFLVDPTVCPRMAQRAGIDDIGVLEIGPGFGALTVELAKRAKKVLAIEIDGDVLPRLRENLADYPNVTVIHGDATKLPLDALIAEHLGGMPVAAVGNLPYYVTSPLVMSLLEKKLGLQSITVMVQKEAAVRFCAKPGSRECGAVSAAVWYYSEPKLLFDVGPGAFSPRPKVNSAVMRLALRDEPAVQVQDEAFFFAVVRAAFGQRRKMAANAISALTGIPRADVDAAIAEAGLPAAVRAERMTLQQFAQLSDILIEKKK